MIRPKRNPKKVSVIRAGPPLLALLMAVGFVASSSRAEKALAVPSPVDEASKQESSATAVFAGGCFWGVQGASSNM
jgi:peptide-methionine (S)-S-oxide reductase